MAMVVMAVLAVICRVGVQANPTAASVDVDVHDANAMRFQSVDSGGRGSSSSSAAGGSKAGDEARKIFCTCPEELNSLPTLCDTVSHQCM
jgi:hypothetical protein